MNIVKEYINKAPRFEDLRVGDIVTILDILDEDKPDYEIEINKQYMITFIKQIQQRACVGCGTNGWCIYVKVNDLKYHVTCDCILGDKGGRKII